MPETRVHQNFRGAYCAYYGCSEGNFVRNLLIRSLPFYLRPLGWLTWILNRDLFSVDVDLIQQLGDLRSGREVNAILGEIDGMRRVERSFWRGTVGLRTTSRRLSAAWQQLEGTIVRPTLAPEQKAPKISANAFVPDESAAILSRRLRQAHTDIVNGRPVDEVLAGLKTTMPSFLKQLEENSPNNPGFAWLRDRLLKEDRVRQLEEENGNLSRTVSSLAVEVQSLRAGVDRQNKA
jgi:hypothetical protein